MNVWWFFKHIEPDLDMKLKTTATTKTEKKVKIKEIIGTAYGQTTIGLVLQKLWWEDKNLSLVIPFHLDKSKILGKTFSLKKPFYCNKSMSLS